jgi:hypothetical protein
MNDAASYVNAPATALVATKCACCGRELVDSVSVETGMGPSCRKRHGYSSMVGSADFEAARAAVGAEEYDALTTEAMRTLEPGKSVAQGIANRLVYRIACDQRGPRVAARVVALHALGFVALAARIADRVGAIKVAEEGSDLVVDAPYSEKFNVEIRTVRGARWDGARRVRLVPVALREQLWDVLRTTFRGHLVVGKRIAVVA